MNNDNLFTYLLLLTALGISAVAGYFSIVGLTLIFSAAFWPIVIMGIVLELGKLVTASFIYRMWTRVNWLMKSYFVISVVVLSAITSLGIFGYLSKSYTSDSVALYDSETKIATNKEILDVERRRLDNLLIQLEKREKGNSRIEKDIKQTQDRISSLTKEIGELQKEKNRQNSEIGPIRYITELFYDKNDLETIDKAVRMIIVILVFVFDPLAILLVVAANMMLRQRPRFKKLKNSIEIEKDAVFSIKNKDLG
jgi:hypothetical protein